MLVETDPQLIKSMKIVSTEAVIGGNLSKKLFLKISQNSQENTCAGVSFFDKVVGLRPATLLKK